MPGKKPPPAYAESSNGIDDVLFNVYNAKPTSPVSTDLEDTGLFVLPVKENAGESIKEYTERVRESQEAHEAHEAHETHEDEDEVYDVKKDYDAFFMSGETRQMTAVREDTGVYTVPNYDYLQTEVVPEDEIGIEAQSESDRITKAELMRRRKQKAEKIRARRRKEHVRTVSHVFGGVLLVIFIVSVSALLANFIIRAALDFTGITVVEYDVTIEIPEGALTADIAEILSYYEIITMPGFFSFYSRISDKDDGYLYGLFTLNSTMSYSQIIATLQTRPRSTETVMVQITEGMTAREIGLLLEENLICRAVDFEAFYRHRMNRFNFELRLEHNPSKFNQMEGYLFPETHEFFVVPDLENNPDMDTSEYAEIAARVIFQHMNSQLTPEMYKGIHEMGFTLDEFMTLASMVQWEAANFDDMTKVASVFINRLNNPGTFPKLESDVTRKYATENIRPLVNVNDRFYEAILTAYDTYISDGLPPGPICNPGLDAMRAVLAAPNLPSGQRGYYYFCADIETGEVFFAQDLREHEANLLRANIDLGVILG